MGLTKADERSYCVMNSLTQAQLAVTQICKRAVILYQHNPKIKQKTKIKPRHSKQNKPKI